MSFTHLHVHTEYSLLDGAARIKDLIAHAKDLGMEALAITDHGSMFGVIEFYREAKAQGIKPIIGCEVYVANRRMVDKTPEKDKHSAHLILLAKNNQGYKNLIKIVSAAYTKGYYYKPRVDKELLRAHSEGIIALSACLIGEVQRKLSNGDYAGAKNEALELQDIFGKGNFYLELQDQGLEEEYDILAGMKKIHEETGIPFVATNDVHYVRQKDAKAHDVLLCIQTGAKVSDEKRMRFPNDQFYLKSENEMKTLFAAIPEAIENTWEIAQKCNVDFKFGELHLPEFKAPDGKENSHYLRELCDKGLRERYENPGEELRERLEYELKTIENMGYVEYFLIVWDFINFAKENSIMVGPGRGSAAGSLVAYALKITDIDPIKYGLIFERFLNPERVSMPDIDIDFCYERRQEVIDYVIGKYGEDKVSQIATFGTMKAKAAVRDVGRVLDLGYAETDAIAKAIPFDLKMTIDKALDINPELRASYEADSQVAQVIDMARAIEGMPRHVSTHAAGVVISKESIDEYVPLYWSEEKGAATQFPMTTIEELGLLKMDFLGLRNLTVIRDALSLIEKNHGVKIELSKLSYDDPKAFEIIAKGNTQGIFQLESGGMTQFMKNLSPDCFEDIVAGISLYRPGPMASIPTYIENKKNPEGIVYLHEKLKPILSVSYGCLVYQEQVMQIVRDLAGYTYGRSDLVRRAMGKKKMSVMLEEKRNFIYGKDDENGNIEIMGCVRNGVPEHIAEEIFNQMVSFAEYAFNKSHAAAYAVLAYETAYLKAYYPTEFMAALMTSVMGDSNSISKYIRNCKEMGISVKAPSINESEKGFSVSEGNIHFGLMGIKNVGAAVIDEIVRSRQEKGRPADIFQFISNIDIHKMNKKAMESLIKAGALDCLNPNRAKHLAVYEGLLESAQNDARKNVAGQMSLFDLGGGNEEMGKISGSLPDVENFSIKTLLALEKEMMGVYISGHPLDEYGEKIKSIISLSSEAFAHVESENGSENECMKDGMKAVVAGMVMSKRTLITRSNKRMAFLNLEDLYGQMEIIVFPNIFERCFEKLKDEAIVVVAGKLSMKEDEAPKLIAENVMTLEESLELKKIGKQKKEAVFIRIPATENETETIEKIKEVISEHRGESEIVIRLEKSGQSFRGGNDLKVEINDKFMKEISDIVGSGNVQGGQI